MTGPRQPRGLWIALAVAVLALAWFAFPDLHDASTWQRQASPGALAPAHAFLEGQCSACHAPLQSVPAAQCIVCHANQTALLQRQATAFHSSVGACTKCHQEHRADVRAVPMDHQALATIGLAQLEAGAPGTDQQQLHHQLAFWLRSPTSAPANARLSAEESLLDCKTCHASRDRHWGLFGGDCAQCHATTQWNIAEFRHPPPSSTDCVQCHQAPPSHFMEHFKMVSMKVAGVENARVDQCYSCHQTTTWNDIRNVGVYKHH